MTSVAIIALAIACLVLLLAALLRSRTSRTDLESAFDSERAVRLPPLAVLDRCLSLDDIEFTARLRAPRVLQLLLSERRRLALRWIRHTRHEVRRVFRRHLQAVRHSADLRPARELRVLVDALSFACLSQILVAVVYFYGPLQSRSFLQSIRSLANLLANLGGRIAVVSPGTFSEAGSLSK